MSRVISPGLLEDRFYGAPSCLFELTFLAEGIVPEGEEIPENFTGPDCGPEWKYVLKQILTTDEFDQLPRHEQEMRLNQVLRQCISGELVDGEKVLDEIYRVRIFKDELPIVEQEGFK